MRYLLTYKSNRLNKFHCDFAPPPSNTLSGFSWSQHTRLLTPCCGGTCCARLSPALSGPGLSPSSWLTLSGTWTVTYWASFCTQLPQCSSACSLDPPPNCTRNMRLLFYGTNAKWPSVSLVICSFTVRSSSECFSLLAVEEVWIKDQLL